MADVIRKDLVEIGFKTDYGGLTKMNREINSLKKSVLGVGNINSFDKISEDADDAGDDIKGATKYSDKFADSLDDVSNTKFDKVQNGINSLTSGLKKGIATATKLATTGIAVGAAAVGAIVKKSVSGYADYEQLVGGVETLFGAGGKSLKEYAK